MSERGQDTTRQIGDGLREGAPVSGAYRFDAKGFPWWLAAMVLVIVAMIVLVIFNTEFREAFNAIFPLPLCETDPDTGEVIRCRLTEGILMTFYLTVGSFIVATVLGLFIGLARVSRSAWLSNASAFYIEFIRGIPMLVWIFFVALALVPDFADLINVRSRAIPMAIRGSLALSLFYAAFIAEVFRAGIQSVSEHQAEAGRALGLTEAQIMRRIILPQAVRNMLPALGNDLIALMKDTSLVSVLAVRELTQMARLYSGSTFRFRESFFILMVIYVVLTLGLSLLLRWYERRVAIPGRT